MEHYRRFFVAILVSVLASYLQNVQCDIYFHNPRGSNNRLNKAGENRANANRLFDSQNNGKGGYNVGEVSRRIQYHMTYFMGGNGKSILTVEWTNQHGCGVDDLNCNIVLQYMCQTESEPKPSAADKIRNGKSTRTQRYRKDRRVRSKSRKESRKRQQVRKDKGLNESWEWYDKCNRRQRNKGLFTADQKLRGDSSKYTRQNPKGNQHGYECPEERDYYPYSHPTPWKDIAVFANKESDCPYYKEESFNTKPKDSGDKCSECGSLD